MFLSRLMKRQEGHDKKMLLLIDCKKGELTNIF